MSIALRCVPGGMKDGSEKQKGMEWMVGEEDERGQHAKMYRLVKE